MLRSGPLTDNSSAPPRVFVVHEPLRRETDPVTKQTDWVRVRDVSAAREFGELRYVYPAGRLTQEETYLVRTAREKLRDFTANDYLLLSGDTAAIAIASLVAAQQLDDNETHLKFLLWDSRLQRYYALCPEVWEADAGQELAVNDTA